MLNQSPITLEELISQLADCQDDKTIHKALASPTLPTTKDMERVLRSLLDPASFYTQNDFAEGLSKAYWRLREDPELRKAYRHPRKGSNAEHPEELQGAIGLVCFTIELLKEAGHRDRTHSTSRLEPLQKLLNDSAVRSWFYKVYAPTTPLANATNQNGSVMEPVKSQNDLELFQKHWQELELDSLKLYRVGTTSFILRCQVGTITGEQLVLKCLLFPYIQISPIADATRKYALDYPSGKLPMTARVRSSTDKWILMDFIEGPTLEELLDKCRKSEGETPPLLRTDLLASIGQPLLEALRDLSRVGKNGIQHEDLTPSNIIVVQKLDGSVERIVLIDLGRNYLYMRKIGLAENREGLFVAPEVRDDKSTNTSDLYSFGMILIDLANPRGVHSTTIPDSFYQYAPALARFVEDLVDVDPAKRLLLFHSEHKKDIYSNLLSAFADELKVLPSDREVKPGMHLSLLVRQIEVKPWVHLWMQQIGSLFWPSDQLKHQFKLWKLTQRSKHIAISKHSGRLFAWLCLCTIHWNIVFTICILWGFLRDIGVSPFSVPMNIAQVYIFHCPNCVPIVDWFGASDHIGNVLANLPARLAAFSIMAQTKYYQNILAGLTAKPMEGRLAWWTELTLRYSAVCGLIPILIGNLYQPGWWLILLILGYITAGANNILCYHLATRALKLARGKLSTVPLSDDPVLEAFRSWGSNMVAYIALLLVIWIGLITGFLHDEWIYVFGTVGVSIFVWCIGKCINLAPSVRGGLNRAFIAGERLQVITKKDKN